MQADVVLEQIHGQQEETMSHQAWLELLKAQSPPPSDTSSNLVKSYCIPGLSGFSPHSSAFTQCHLSHSHGLSNSGGLLKHGGVYLQTLHSQEPNQDRESEVSSVYIARPVSQ